MFLRNIFAISHAEVIQGHPVHSCCQIICAQIFVELKTHDYLHELAVIC